MCVCLILEIRVCISTFLFWQARFLIGYKVFLPYSLHHQFDLSHFSQCLTSLAFLFVGEVVYKPVLFHSIQRIKMLFFRDISLYKESCSISFLFFSLPHSPSMLWPRVYYIWRHLAQCFPKLSQPKTPLGIQLNFLVLFCF